MTTSRVAVRSEKVFNASLWGPALWWSVWLTPFQKVASFNNQNDAMTWANIWAIQLNKRDQA